jgi:RecA-family ATPase
MSTHDKRAAAVALARRGFRVFKLEENSKLPLTEGWPDHATAWPEAVHRLWSDPVSGEAFDNNIGVLCDGMEVLDPDVKRKHQGIDGLASLDDLVDTYALDTNTFTVQTPTGGRHLYYRLPDGEQVRNSADQIAKGIDVRGYHGFVVGPGSTINGVPYEIVNDVEPLEAPRWLIKAAGRPTPKADNAGEVVVPVLDTPVAIERAVRYLEHESPVSVPGVADDTLFRIAARVKDFGISQERNKELIVEHYLDGERCQVVWPIDEALQKVTNAYKSGNQPVGVSSVEADFGPVEHGVAKPRRGIEFIEWDDIDPLSDPVTAQIEGWFDLGSLVVGYGAPNAGKTHVFLSMAVSIAAGQPWCGRIVRQGGVVYVAAEGGRGLKRRAGAYRKKYGWKKIPFWLRSGALDLMRPDGDIKGFIQKIKDIQATGQSVELIVIDTLARVMAGGDENSTKEMSAFVRNCDLIREATGCTVLLVHHTGKDKTKGSRGSNALLGAVDTELMVEANKVWSTKQRDAEKAAPISFALETVDLGVDANGRPQAGVVLKQTAAAEFEARLNENEKTLLKAFDKLLLGLENDDEDCDEMHEPRPSATWKQLREAALKSGLRHTSYSAALRTLCGVGLIYKNEQNQYVRGPAS